MRATAAAIASLIAVLVAAPAAPAAPGIPASPEDWATVDTRRPEFRWTIQRAQRDTIGWEVHAEGLGAVATVLDPATTSAVPAADLPDDARIRWFVRRLRSGGQPPEDTREQRRRVLTIATVPGPPAIVEGPLGPTAAAAPAFAWTGDRVASRWALLGPAGAVAGGDLQAGDRRAETGPLPDGEYVFRVAQVNIVGAEGPGAERRFTLDTVAPGPPAVLAAPSLAAMGDRLSFAWGAVEPGARCEWQVLGPGGVLVRGPVVAATWTAAVDGLAPASYLFQVRQIDAAGNAGQWASTPFAVLGLAGPGAPPAAGAPPGASAGPRLRLPAVRARALRPRAGARLRVRRPLLRWAPGPAGTRVYNVQVFRVAADGALRKVYSGFPRRRELRLPAGRLARGACYVWRVWPFLRDGRFAPRPVGVSNFCVAARRRR